MLDSVSPAAVSSRSRPASRDFRPPAPCASYPNIREIFSKMPWGGPRANSGGARPGAGRPRRKALPIHPPPRNDEPRWYVVRSLPDWSVPRCGSKAGNQRLADIELRLAGFEVFNPSLWKAAEPARRDRGVIRPAKPDRIEPLFPRFLFVRLNLSDPSWHAIQDLPGVGNILHGPGTGAPAAVDDAIVEMIRGMCDELDCIYPPKRRRRPIARGTLVRILSGPFAGLEAISTWSDGLRVELLVSFFGRETPTRADQADVEVV